MHFARQLGIDFSMYRDETLHLLLSFPASNHTLNVLLQILANSRLDPATVDAITSTLPTALVTDFFAQAEKFHAPKTASEGEGEPEEVFTNEHHPFNLIATKVAEQLSQCIQFCALLIQWDSIAGKYLTNYLLNMPEKGAFFSNVAELPFNVQNFLVRSIPFINSSLIVKDFVKPWLTSKLAPIIIYTVYELKTIILRQNSSHYETQQNALLGQMWKNIRLLVNICEISFSADLVLPIREKLFLALTDLHPNDQQHILTIIAEQRPNEAILLKVLEIPSSGIHKFEQLLRINFKK